MENKMIGTVITLTVVIICVAAILMPVVSDAQGVTYTNTATDGIEYSAMDDFTISKDADSLTFTINDEDFEVTTGQTALIYSSEMIINFVTGYAGLITTSATTITAKALSGTCVDGTFTYSIDSGDEVSIDLTNILVATTDGDYVGINVSATEILAQNKSDIRAWAWSNSLSTLYTSIGETVTTSTDSGATLSITLDDYATTMGAIAYVDGETTISSASVIVPKTFFIENAYGPILGVIPVMILVSLVVLATRTWAGAKN